MLYKFLGGDDGIEPTDRLVFDKSGNLFGTTEIGGTFNGCNEAGCGTVFKLTPPGQPGSPWIETVLYRFSGGSDGFVPRGVVFGRGGLLYGTTEFGGSTSACLGSGCGMVFSTMP